MEENWQKRAEEIDFLELYLLGGSNLKLTNLPLKSIKLLHVSRLTHGINLIKLSIINLTINITTVSKHSVWVMDINLQSLTLL